MSGKLVVPQPTTWSASPVCCVSHMDRRTSRHSFASHRLSFISRSSFTGSLGGSSNLSDSFLNDDFDVPELSGEEEDRARRLFHDACREAASAAGTSFTSSAREIGQDIFAKLVTQLTKETNEALVARAEEEAKRRGGTKIKPELQSLPKAKDLHAAFKIADVDKSGAVDEEEFLLLFRKVKAGKVSGLGGGIWSMLGGMRLSPNLHASKEVTLTEDEKSKARSVFRRACMEANQVTGAAVVLYELDVEAFSACIERLTREENERAAAEATGELQPTPQRSDLEAAFVQADTDKSGMVDEDEFIELYTKVKAGKVKGLGGGFLKNAGNLLVSKYKRHKHHDAVNSAITAKARAIREQTIEIHQWLASKGFDPDELDRPASPKYSGDPNTYPMSLACKNGKVRVCAWLLSNGQDIRRKDVNGDTPLHLAARAGRLGVCRWLLDNGATDDIKARNARGETPLMAATRNANQSVLDLLRNPPSPKFTSETTEKQFDLSFPIGLVSPTSRLTTPNTPDLQEIVLGKRHNFPSSSEKEKGFQYGWVVHGINGKPTKLDPSLQLAGFVPQLGRQISPTSEEAIQQHYSMVSSWAVDKSAVDKSNSATNVEGLSSDQIGNKLYQEELQVSKLDCPDSAIERDEVGVEHQLSKYFHSVLRRGVSRSKHLKEGILKRLDADARNEVLHRQTFVKESRAVDLSEAASSPSSSLINTSNRIYPIEDDEVSFGSLSSLSTGAQNEHTT